MRTHRETRKIIAMCTTKQPVERVKELVRSPHLRIMVRQVKQSCAFSSRKIMSNNDSHPPKAKSADELIQSLSQRRLREEAHQEALQKAHLEVEANKVDSPTKKYQVTPDFVDPHRLEEANSKKKKRGNSVKARPKKSDASQKMSTYSDSTKRVKRRYHRHLRRGTNYPSKALQRSTPRPPSCLPSRTKLISNRAQRNEPGKLMKKVEAMTTMTLRRRNIAMTALRASYLQAWHASRSCSCPSS